MLRQMNSADVACMAGGGSSMGASATTMRLPRARPPPVITFPLFKLRIPILHELRWHDRHVGCGRRKGFLRICTTRSMPSPTNQGGTMTKRPMTGCTQMTQHRLLQLPRLRGQLGIHLLQGCLGEPLHPPVLHSSIELSRLEFGT